MERIKFEQIARDLLEVKCRWRKMDIKEVIDCNTEFHPRIIAKPRESQCETCGKCVLDARQTYYCRYSKNNVPNWMKKCHNCGKITGTEINQHK